jgi:hypothetical protein
MVPSIRRMTNVDPRVFHLNTSDGRVSICRFNFLTLVGFEDGLKSEVFGSLLAAPSQEACGNGLSHLHIKISCMIGFCQKKKHYAHSNQETFPPRAQFAKNSRDSVLSTPLSFDCAIEANTSSCFTQLTICIESIHEAPPALRLVCTCTAQKRKKTPGASIRLDESTFTPPTRTSYFLSCNPPVGPCLHTPSVQHAFARSSCHVSK